MATKAKTNRKELSATQLESWINTRSAKEIKRLAELIGRRIVNPPERDGMVRITFELPADDAFKKHIATLDPIDRLHLLTIQEMLHCNHSFLNHLQTVVNYSVDYAVDQQIQRVEGKRGPDVERSTKVYYLRFYRRLSFGQIKQQLRLPITVKGVENLFKRTRDRIKSGECGKYERNMLVWVAENGIDNMKDFYNQPDNFGGDE